VGDHPVKVPAELLKKLLEEFYGGPTTPGEATIEIANKVAQWAADQELEACRKWLVARGVTLQIIEQLRAARRPKPPSLAEQALEQYEGVEDILSHHGRIPAGCIRAALNRLAELEAQQ